MFDDVDTKSERVFSCGSDGIAYKFNSIVDGYFNRYLDAKSLRRCSVPLVLKRCPKICEENSIEQKGPTHKWQKPS